MATRPAIFKWRQTEPALILCAVRWYLRYSLSLRDVEELLEERGLEADHTTVWRWVQRYSPELEQRLRRRLKPTNKSWRVDETYVRIKGRWCYMYRAIDSAGATVDFLLSALFITPSHHHYCFGDYFEERYAQRGFVTWLDYLHPEDKDRLLRALYAYLDGETKEYTIEYRIRHRDGTYRWMLARGTAIRDQAGKPIRLVGSRVDITELKRVEEVLRESEAWFRFMANAMPQIVWTARPDG